MFFLARVAGQGRPRRQRGGFPRCPCAFGAEPAHRATLGVPGLAPKSRVLPDLCLVAGGAISYVSHITVSL